MYLETLIPKRYNKLNQPKKLNFTPQKTLTPLLINNFQFKNISVKNTLFKNSQFFKIDLPI